MHRSSLALAFLAVMGLSACSRESETSSMTAPVAADRTVSAAATEAMPTKTAVAATTDTGATGMTAAAPTTDLPLVLGAPKRVGAGLIEDWSPDGTALIVGLVDETLSKEGCEGAKEPVFFLQPIDGGAPTVAFPGHTEMNGSFVGTQPGTDDVVMLSGCEGYLGDLTVAHQSGASVAIDTGGRGGAHIAEATAGRFVVSDGKTV